MRLSEAAAIERCAGLLIDRSVPSRQIRNAHGMLICPWHTGYCCVRRLHTITVQWISNLLSCATVYSGQPEQLQREGCI